MPTSYSLTELKVCLGRLGIIEGDCLFVHSSLKSLGKLATEKPKESLNALLGCLQEVLGQTGTIVVPTFNFGFCQGQPFDRQTTPSEGMGAFSEFLRAYPGAERSPHPFQCVSALGRLSSKLASATGRTAFSAGSAFDEMLKQDAKILFLGVDFVETFVHVAEERANVPYRFWKTFHGRYYDNGVAIQIDVDFYARKLDLLPEPLLDKPKLNQYIRSKDVMVTEGLGSGHVSACRASRFVDEFTAVLKANPLDYLLKA